MVWKKRQLSIGMESYYKEDFRAECENEYFIK